MNRTEITLPGKPDYKYNEAIKTLRTNIQFSGSSLKTIIITSTAPDEGKSSISWDLAFSFAEAGKKILFIDADLRKSVFLKRHNIRTKVTGLSEMLSGQARLQDGIYETNIPNLFMIYAGPFTPNPTELFEDRNCDELFRMVQEDGTYDYIIVDTAPLGTVIDAAVLARHADGIAVVVESEVTSRRLLSKVNQQIEKTGVRNLGVILNKVRMSKGSYYNSYYYHYGRKKYGSYSDDYYSYGYGRKEPAKDEKK
jgi:capsular exopolysaccharide synthesis family protein